MRGFYRYSVDGQVVGESENIVTDDGKILIAKYLASLIGSYAGAIAVGVGEATPTSADKTLEFEFARAPIIVRNVTGPSSEIFQVSFKGVLPAQLEGNIRESAIISQVFNTYSGSYGDKLLAKFTENEGWTEVSASSMVSTSESLGYDVAYDSIRIGGSSIRLTSTGAGSIELESSTVQGDFSGYSSDDTFAVAYSGAYIPSGTSVEIRFYSDADNYWFKSFSPVVNTSSVWEYNISKFQKSEFSQSGSPNWSSIVKCVVIVAAGGTDANMILDGLSLFDTDYINPDYAVISRSVVSSLINKEAGKTMDVEYFLEFKL